LPSWTRSPKPSSGPRFRPPPLRPSSGPCARSTHASRRASGPRSGGSSAPGCFSASPGSIQSPCLCCRPHGPRRRGRGRGSVSETRRTETRISSSTYGVGGSRGRGIRGPGSESGGQG
jgi:hypothetical protein